MYQKAKGIAKRRAHVRRLNRKAEKVLRRMFYDSPAENDAWKFAPFWRDNLAKCSCDMCTGHDKDHRYRPSASEWEDTYYDDDEAWASHVMPLA